MRTHTDDTWAARAPTRRHLGVRSLAVRMLLLFVIPLVVAQVLVLRELRTQRAAADDAAALAQRTTLLADTAAIYAPAAFEEVTSVGIAYVDSIHIDRATVARVIQMDYVPYMRSGRERLDAALDTLAARHADVVLADGRLLGATIAELRAGLDATRADLDRREADGTAVASSIAAVVDLADAVIRQERSSDLRSDDPRLRATADRAARLAKVMEAVSFETRALFSDLAVPNPLLGVNRGMAATGAADAALAEYGAVTDDEAGWSALLRSPPVAVFDDLRPTIARSVLQRYELDAEQEMSGIPVFLTNTEYISEIAQVLRAALERLHALEDDATRRFVALTDSARAIGGDARADVTRWTSISIAALAVELLALALTLWTTVRPLRRLTTRALEVGGGDIRTEPLPVVGPSDIRAVTATFNTMVATLGAFEEQLHALASNAALDPDAVGSVPGSLGASLRASVGHLADVTVRLRESEALARAIVGTAHDAIWTVDQRGVVLSVNAAGERLMALPRAQQLGLPLARLCGGCTDVVRSTGEIEFRRPDGLTIHALVSHGDVQVDDHRVRAVFARDISDRKRFEERLAHQARHDVLTGLPNRLATVEHLDALLGDAEVVAAGIGVLFIDLDGFKAVNDTRGHASGDLLLRGVARRLRSAIRDHELVGRLGGDEFLVITDDCTTSSLLAMAQRCIDVLGTPFDIDGDSCVVAASIGAAFTRTAVDGLELVRRADVALYHAKDAGRGQVTFFDDSLREAAEAHAEVELALRQAVMRDELLLHFQPIVSLRDDRPWGAEVLLRWDRPGHGLLLPDRFIPIAERSTLIIDIERWVLRRALGTLAEWQRDPSRRDLRLAINISGRHLVEGDVVGDLADAVRATRADPSALEIELTETHLLADLDRANAILRALRAWGVDIAVDDFGTGYSSMSYLRQLEVDTIKIDRTFVGRVQHEGYDRTIVEVLLQLADTLGLDVVAEGVETAEQLAFLRDHRCSRVQGFHFSRPMELVHMTEWLDAWRRSELATGA